jgi:transcriptional regulator with XRE-family HTH domain
MPAQPLNQQQLDDAARLKKHFLAWQQKRKDAGEPSSQEAAAGILGFVQSALSQYLNGGIPLAIDSAITFAKTFGILVDDFSPTIAERIRGAAKLVAGAERKSASIGAPKWISEDAYKLLDLYSSCDERARNDILSNAVQVYAQQPRLASVASNDD